MRILLHSLAVILLTNCVQSAPPQLDAYRQLLHDSVTIDSGSGHFNSEFARSDRSVGGSSQLLDSISSGSSFSSSMGEHLPPFASVPEGRKSFGSFHLGSVSSLSDVDHQDPFGNRFFPDSIARKRGNKGRPFGAFRTSASSQALSIPNSVSKGHLSEFPSRSLPSAGSLLDEKPLSRRPYLTSDYRLEARTSRRRNPRYTVSDRNLGSRADENQEIKLVKSSKKENELNIIRTAVEEQEESLDLVGNDLSDVELEPENSAPTEQPIGSSSSQSQPPDYPSNQKLRRMRAWWSKIVKKWQELLQKLKSWRTSKKKPSPLSEFTDDDDSISEVGLDDHKEEKDEEETSEVTGLAKNRESRIDFSVLDQLNQLGNQLGSSSISSSNVQSMQTPSRWQLEKEYTASRSAPQFSTTELSAAGSCYSSCVTPESSSPVILKNIPTPVREYLKGPVSPKQNTPVARSIFSNPSATSAELSSISSWRSSFNAAADGSLTKTSDSLLM